MLIKVCGMRNAHNISEIEPMVDYMGFIFYPRSSRYVSTPPDYLPARCRRVGVFVDSTLGNISTHISEYGLHAVQLHGAEDNSLCAVIKELHREVEVIKAIGVSSAADVQLAAMYPDADMLLFDTRTPQHGGSGVTFDWNVLHAYQGINPFLLSGGISPDSIDALRTFRHPRLAGYDLNSRFELSPGMKDAERLRSFINMLKGKI